jgi:hypothetical protein
MLRKGEAKPHGFGGKQGRLTELRNQNDLALMCHVKVAGEIEQFTGCGSAIWPRRWVGFVF